MDPADRVLVCVINRRRDLIALRTSRWYRIPQQAMPDGLDADYLAFFLSRAFGPLNGGVHFYAKVRGFELTYRRWLLPDEPNHPHADALYFRISLGALLSREPSLLNTGQHSVSFIRTTGERFMHAETLSDLYLRTQTG
jgi:hypothetical protein